MTLTASGSNITAYGWTGPGSHSSSAASLAITNATLTDGGIYTVTFIDNNSCTNTNSITVTVNPLPVVTTLVDCTLGVGQGVITVTSPTGADYQYNLNGGSFQASPIFGTLANGSYTVIVENISTNCSSAPSIVTVDCGCTNPPVLSLTETSGNICGIALPYTLNGNTFGGSATAVTLSHDGGGSLNITSATTSPFSFTYTPVSSDLGNIVTITVATNNPLGTPCTIEQQTFSLTINPNPVVSINPISGTLCPSVGTQDITATITSPTASDYTYTWGGGLSLTGTPVTQSSTTSTVTATIPTACGSTYPVTFSVSDGNGCTASATPININVDDNTSPSISGSIATSTVEGCSILDAPAAATTVAELEGMGLTISDDCTSKANLAVESNDVTSGTCPIEITRTYTITDACGNFSTVPHTIIINQADFTMPSAGGSTVSCASAISAPTLPVVQDACGVILTQVVLLSVQFQPVMVL